MDVCVWRNEKSNTQQSCRRRWPTHQACLRWQGEQQPVAPPDCKVYRMSIAGDEKAPMMSNKDRGQFLQWNVL